MQPEVHNSYEEIAQLPAQVYALCERLSIRIRPGSDFSRMLDLCTNVDTKISNMKDDELLEVCRAQRVLQAIVACEGEAEIKAPLGRIAANTLNLTSPAHSAGKDSVFELEFLQYIRHRGLIARLGEPDIVVKGRCEDYFIACKSINSFNNLKGQLRSGYGQVESYGHGCVALNLEPHMCFEQPLCAGTANEVRNKLNSQLRSLYGDHKRLFDRKLQDGRIDGIILQMSCLTYVAESCHDLDVFTHTVYYSRSNLQDQAARTRFNEFRMAMQSPLNKGFG